MHLRLEVVPHRRDGIALLGRHAAACGYGVFATSLPGESVDNSLAIELDCFNNSAAATWGDLDSNHISVHTGGSGDNSEHESYSIGRALTGALGTDLNNAATHTLRVLYVPGTLEVYLDGNLQISAPYDFVTGGTWIDSGTPVGGLNLINGTSAYVGFTSGAGSAREFRDIQNWTWTSSCPPAITAFCAGDGALVDHTTPCPCGNDGSPGKGCANSVTSAGAVLGGTGVPANDGVVLTANGMPTTAACVFLQGDALADAVFGDGVRCVGGMLLRLRTRTSAGGTAVFPNSTDTTTLAQRGGVVPGSGVRRFYQTYYRNSAAFCTPDTFNVTNGWRVDW